MTDVLIFLAGVGVALIGCRGAAVNAHRAAERAARETQASIEARKAVVREGKAQAAALGEARDQLACVHKQAVVDLGELHMKSTDRLVAVAQRHYNRIHGQEN